MAFDPDHAPLVSQPFWPRVCLSATNNPLLAFVLVAAVFVRCCYCSCCCCCPATPPAPAALLLTATIERCETERNCMFYVWQGKEVKKNNVAKPKNFQKQKFSSRKQLMNASVCVCVCSWVCMCVLPDFECLKFQIYLCFSLAFRYF